MGMANRKSRVISILTPISFVISLVSLILVISDAENFANKNLDSKQPKHIQETQTLQNFTIENTPSNTDNVAKSETNEVKSSEIKPNQETNTKPQNNTSNIMSTKSIDIDDIISDLETIHAKKTGNKQQPANNTATLQPQTKIKTQIQFKSFSNKDDATLELNRLRVKHKDLTSKIDTFVKKIKVGEVEKYIIAGNVNGDIKIAQDLCDKFEVRNVVCNIID